MTRSYPVLGHSMRFLMEPGDTADASPCRPEDLRAGELALIVKWEEGRPAGYIVHRVIVNSPAGSSRFLLTKGDSNLLPDLPRSSFQPVARVTSFSRGGRSWNASPGAAWPLTAAASFLAGKLLSSSVAAVFFLFAAAVRLLPRQFSAVLDRAYLSWESAVYPYLLRRLCSAALPPGESVPSKAASEVHSGRITGRETWSGRVVVADYLSIERGASVTVLPGTEITFERREPWFFPVARAGIDGSLRELDSANAKLLVYGDLRVKGDPAAPVIFRGPSFGGVRLLAGGRADIAGALFEGSTACPLGAGDDSRMEISGCSFLSCRSAIEISGRASFKASDCEIEGSDGGGIRGLDLASISLSGIRVSGCSGPGVESSGLTATSVFNAFISECSVGIAASERAVISVAKSRVEASRGHAMEAGHRASLSARQTVFAGNAAGVRGDGGAVITAEDCSFEGQGGPAGTFSGGAGAFARCSFVGNGAGFESSSAGISLNGCSFTGQSGASVLCSGGSADILDCSFSGNASGVRAENGARARLENCRFEAQAGPGFCLSGASGRIALCSFRGNASGTETEDGSSLIVRQCSFTGHGGAGAFLSGGRAEFSSCSFEGNSAGVEGILGSRIILRDCSLEGNSGPAAAFSGGAAEVYGTSFRGNEGGLSFSGGCRGSVRDCGFYDNRSASLQAHKGSSVLVSVCDFSGGPAALLLDGGEACLRSVKMDKVPFPGIIRRALEPLETDDVTYAGRPWKAPAPVPSRAGGRRMLFSFVAATAGYPGFSSIYRLFYLVAPRAASLILALPGLRSIYLYRGMAAAGWEPGLSDMDLACLTAPSGPEEDLRIWQRLRRRTSFLKNLFPFTGEIMIATQREFGSFLSSWGVKGSEFSGASVLLRGEPLPVVPGRPGDTRADRTEAFYAYTILMRQFFSSGLPDPFVRRNCLKNMVDVKRYLAGPSPAKFSRRAFAAQEGTPLDDFMGVAPEASAYDAFRALHEASAGAAGETSGGVPAGPHAAAWFDHDNFTAVCRRLADDSGLESAVVLDALYRVYFVLPDAVAEDKSAFLRACAALRAGRAASPMLNASPLVLTRRAFYSLTALPYLNNPCFAFDLRGSGVPCGLTPDDGGIYRFGLDSVPAPALGEDLRTSAILAARHFCASWRSLWTEMPPHYFYTRSLGLALAIERGDPLSFSSPAALSNVLPVTAGTGIPAWPDYCAGGAGSANYRFISERSELLRRLCDAA